MQRMLSLASEAERNYGDLVKGGSSKHARGVVQARANGLPSRAKVLPKAHPGSVRIDHAVLRKLEGLASRSSEALLVVPMLELKRLVKLLPERRHVRGGIQVRGRLQLSRVSWVPAGRRRVESHITSRARCRCRLAAVIPVPVSAEQPPPFQIPAERRAVPGFPACLGDGECARKSMSSTADS